MKQLGNLAITVAKKKGVLLQILNGMVTVHTGYGPERSAICVEWQDDEAIGRIIQELNFGRCVENKNDTEAAA